MPNATKRRRLARSVATGLLAGLSSWWGCAGEAEPPMRAYPEQIRWTRVARAATYRVQAWSGLRLIFEESVPDTTLVLSSSMLRALASFDSVDVQIRAIGDDGMLGLQRFPLHAIHTDER